MGRNHEPVSQKREVGGLSLPRPKKSGRFDEVSGRPLLYSYLSPALSGLWPRFPERTPDRRDVGLTQNGYHQIRNSARAIKSDTPVIITDVFYNSTIASWSGIRVG